MKSEVTRSTYGILSADFQRGVWDNHMINLGDRSPNTGELILLTCIANYVVYSPSSRGSLPPN